MGAVGVDVEEFAPQAEVRAVSDAANPPRRMERLLEEKWEMPSFGCGSEPLVFMRGILIVSIRLRECVGRTRGCDHVPRGTFVTAPKCCRSYVPRGTSPAILKMGHSGNGTPVKK